jgi:hypothetical protein
MCLTGLEGLQLSGRPANRSDSGNELRVPRKVEKEAQGEFPYSNVRRWCQALVTCQLMANESR